MARVERKDLLDYLNYLDHRAAIRASAMTAKALRRVHLGEHLTFLFENVETIRYQVLEMLRVERRVREADVQHELDTFNALLGQDGELGCTLLIELPDGQDRAEQLRRWRDLPGHIFMVFTDGTRSEARFDSNPMNGDKLSAVQFLKFTVAGRIPSALVSDLPGLSGEVVLPGPTRHCLIADAS